MNEDRTFQLIIGAVVAVVIVVMAALSGVSVVILVIAAIAGVIAFVLFDARLAESAATSDGAVEPSLVADSGFAEPSAYDDHGSADGDVDAGDGDDATTETRSARLDPALFDPDSVEIKTGTESTGRAFSIRIAKHGHSIDECEDSVTVDPRRAVLAIADGASDSFGAGEWAETLTKRFVKRPPKPLSVASFARWLEEARAESAASVPSAVSVASDASADSSDDASAEASDDPSADSSADASADSSDDASADSSADGADSAETDESIGWWSEEGARRGAFSTLAGAAMMTDGDARVVTVMCLGDSCAFVLTGPPGERTVRRSLPYEDASQFGSHPALLGSIVGSDHGDPSWTTVPTVPGDVVVLASDATAEWLLRNPRRLAMFDGDEPAAIARLLVEERTDGRIVNDDLAVALLEMTE
jgi:hypothetical protein